MNPIKCSNESCNSQTFITTSQKEKICLECSFVQEQNNLVSDIHFENNQLTGKIIRHDRNMPSFMTISEQSRQKAQKIIYQIAHNMNIPDFDAEPALQAYLYAYHRNFIKGRHSAHVAAACLYIVSRERNKPQLLIDFSDALHVNIIQKINLYTLGACFLKLVRFLHKDLPLIDPCVFIRRFCSSLEFEQKQLEVEITANRLLKRMRKDWLEQGRRPSSLCGAAILIAARYHGFKRTTQQMVRVVNVCDETLRKRIEEFKQTSVAKLTREEFASLDQGLVLEEEHYPPCFKNAIKRKEKLALTNFEDKLQQKADKIEKELNFIEQTSQSNRSRQNSSQFIFDDTFNSLNFNQENNQVVIIEQNQCNKLDEISDGSISDMEEQEKNNYILSSEESRIKTLIWNNMHKDWIQDQDGKIATPTKKTTPGLKKKLGIKNEGNIFKIVINAQNAYSALIQDSKIKGKLNQSLVKQLFDLDNYQCQEPIIQKRIQLDAL